MNDFQVQVQVRNLVWRGSLLFQLRTPPTDQPGQDYWPARISCNRMNVSVPSVRISIRSHNEGGRGIVKVVQERGDGSAAYSL
jgi:hypothetical protein